MKQVRKQKTREALIEVGLELIHSTGYTATGINQIMAKAQVRSFYSHFASKDELVLEVIKRYMAIERERWDGVFRDPNLSPLNRLRQYFEVMIAARGASNGPIIGCLLGNLALEIHEDSTEIRHLLRQELDLWQEALASMIREAVRKQELPRSTKPDNVAAVLIDNWQGAQIRAKTQQSDVALLLFFESAFNVLLRPTEDESSLIHGID